MSSNLSGALPQAPAKPIKKQLSWWTRPDDANRWWATGLRGRYVVALYSDYWNAEHRRGRARRQLGVAPTAKEAKAIAQAHYDLAHRVEARQ
jgi:hypothetical protein